MRVVLFQFVVVELKNLSLKLVCSFHFDSIRVYECLFGCMCVHSMSKYRILFHAQNTHVQKASDRKRTRNKTHSIHVYLSVTVTTLNSTVANVHQCQCIQTTNNRASIHIVQRLDVCLTHSFVYSSIRSQCVYVCLYTTLSLLKLIINKLRETSLCLYISFSLTHSV